MFNPYKDKMSDQRHCIDNEDEFFVVRRTFNEDFSVRRTHSKPKSHRNILGFTQYLFAIYLLLILCIVSLCAAESNGCDFIGRQVLFIIIVILIK